jgi:hypothetical protein
MSQVNYQAMSTEELKQYWIQHGDDKAALQVYLDKLNQQPHEIITTVDDPEFEAKSKQQFRRRCLEGNRSKQ